MQAAEGAPIKLFCSYSHKDEELRNELAEHLFPLERAGLIEVWHDREMLPGDTVDAEIAEKLRSADLVLVLVSPSFIHSEYCYDTEFKNAIERHERGEARVVPVVLRPCQWQLTPLKALLAMPTDGRAVINWPNRDTAYDNVARGVAKLANEMRQKGIKAADPAAAGAKPASAGTSTPSPLTMALSRAREREISPRLPESLARLREREGPAIAGGSGQGKRRRTASTLASIRANCRISLCSRISTQPGARRWLLFQPGSS